MAVTHAHHCDDDLTLRKPKRNTTLVVSPFDGPILQGSNSGQGGLAGWLVVCIVTGRW